MATQKELTREQLETIKEALKVAERPEKKTFKRKEAITALLPEIRRLRNKKKLSFAEIAQVIAACSSGEIKPKAGELEKMMLSTVNLRPSVNTTSQSQEGDRTTDGGDTGDTTKVTAQNRGGEQE